jgi:hypothetical protein
MWWLDEGVESLGNGRPARFYSVGNLCGYMQGHGNGRAVVHYTSGDAVMAFKV